MVMLSAVLLAASICFSQPGQPAQSVQGNWQFSATCDTPSTTLDGGLTIVFDSASFVVGALKIGKKTEPFHGRRLDNRFIARTDSGFEPVVRIDVTLDSSCNAMSGIMHLSNVTAVDHKKKKQKYLNVIYQAYVVRKQD